MNSKTKHLFLIFLALCIVLIFLNSIGFLKNLNAKISDNLYGGQTPLQNIVIIQIDDESINELGSWPIKRTNYATLIDKLNESKIIGIDIGFYEKSNPIDDENLKKALKQNKDKVILSFEYLNFYTVNNTVTGQNIQLPIFNVSNLTLGYINTILDSDGVSRAVNLNVKGDYNSFTQEIYYKYLDENFTYNQNRFLINYVNIPYSFQSYKLIDVLNDKVDKNEFKNKIVLVGATANNLHDNLLVPTSKNGILMSGVEVHANILQTMLLKNNLKELSTYHENLMIIIVCLLTILILNYFRISNAIVILSLSILGYIFLTIIIFDYNILLNIVYMPFTVITTFTTTMIYYYKSEEKNKTKIKKAFGKYVSPILIEELIKYPDKLKLGGEKKEITILFSDIANFTSISEKISPEDLVQILNEYLTEMTEIVLKNEGLVDKFIGDAIMAFWGAPIENKKQTELACITALEMLETLRKIKKGWEEKYDVNIDARIGLNFGNAIIGNLGSHNRFDYTAIGDSVNLSSRLEGINKNYGTNLMVSENVYNKVKDKFILREIDSVKVKGKKKPTKIYELIAKKYEDDNKSLDPKQQMIIEQFEKALELYRKQQFTKAQKIFEELHLKHKDKPSYTFIKRIEQLKNEKLDKNWDGVYEMKTK